MAIYLTKCKRLRLKIKQDVQSEYPLLVSPESTQRTNLPHRGLACCRLSTQLSCHQPEAPLKALLSSIWRTASRCSALGKVGNLLHTHHRYHDSFPRPKAVAEFQLLTGHDYLPSHLHHPGVVDSDLCSLCYNEIMDSSDVQRCDQLIALED